MQNIYRLASIKQTQQQNSIIDNIEIEIKNDSSKQQENEIHKQSVATDC